MIGYGWLNGATHTNMDGRVRMSEWRSHTCMTERRVCTLPFVTHVFVSPFIGRGTPCLSHPFCVWRPINQLYPSSCWMTATHTHNIEWQREWYNWLSRGRTHVWERERHTFPLSSMCVPPFNQPYPSSLSSMLCMVPIQPSILLLWLIRRHKKQREWCGWLNRGRTREWQK